ncbi:MAG: hypothetical protein GF398_17365 [Chitinivibrionales bacterium]|nr:hypothetical protein [Chitinivibrionales bacterium]
MGRHFSICCVAACIAGAYCLADIRGLPPALPSSPHQAYQWLQDGMLDSAVWREIEPFYLEPIIVPEGELERLATLLPEWQWLLNIPPDTLESFKPWDAYQIKRFFTRYPDLKLFKPVLSFHDPDARVWLTGLFQVAVVERNRPPVVLARVNSIKSELVSVRSSATLDADIARWNRRSIRLTPLRRLKATLGNFHRSGENGFAFGYFPGVDLDNQEVGENWLFARSRTWNGIAVDYQPVDALDNALFVHYRPTERIGGFATAMRYRNAFGRIGLKGLIAHESERATNDSLLFGDIDAAYDFSAFGVSFSSTAALSPLRSSMPFRLGLEHVGEELAARSDFVYIPSTFSSPRSRLLHRYRSTLDLDSLPSSVSELSTQIYFKLAKILRIKPCLSYVYCSTRSALAASVRLSGSDAFDYACTYRYVAADSELAHKFIARVSDFKLAALKLDGRLALYATNDDFMSASLRQACLFEFGELFQLAPELYLYANTADHIKIVPGIHYQCELFEKTATRLSLEFPFENARFDEMYFRATARFLL